MIRKGAVEKTESFEVDGRYCMTCRQMKELSDHYKGRFEYGLACFKLGFIQGMKKGAKK